MIDAIECLHVGSYQGLERVSMSLLWDEFEVRRHLFQIFVLKLDLPNSIHLFHSLRFLLQRLIEKFEDALHILSSLLVLHVIRITYEHKIWRFILEPVNKNVLVELSFYSNLSQIRIVNYT